METDKSRRRFLKNTSLGAIAAGILPLTTLAGEEGQQDVNSCTPTTLDYYGEGPFYTANPPQIKDKKLAKTSEVGTRLVISGRVMDLNCNPIPNTLIDIWHANNAGDYDNQGYNLRGTTQSNAQGFYEFETIKPGKYLNGASHRPSHIHFKITPPNKPTLITQLYFDGDTDIAGDAAASITNGTYDATGRIIVLNNRAQGGLEGTWDISVDGDGVIDNGGKTSLQNIHQNTGMVYKVAPNPFKGRVEIQFGVFNAAHAGLLVFDAIGNEVANLQEEHFEAGKYSVIWDVPQELPKGSYYIALKINQLQVHYLKVLKL